MTEYIKNHEKQIVRIIFVFGVLAAVKSIFTDTGFDNAYTISMSYRHLNGDDMFHYMWEPHQTSIFVTDVLMWVYRFFIPSFSGVMLFLQCVGTAVLGLVSYALYKSLSKVSGKSAASLAGLFFFIFRVKQSPFLDYANLMICFSTLGFICLIGFVNNQKKTRLLILAGLLLCLEVLAYPSGLLTFLAVAVVLFFATEKRWRNIGILSGVCVLTGLGYLMFFVGKLGLQGLISGLKNMLYSDSHQTGEMLGPGGYFNNMEYVLGWLLVSLAVSLLIFFVLKAFRKEPQFLSAFGISMLVIEICMLFLQKRLGIDWTVNYYILPLLLMVLAASVGFKKMTKEERIIWLSGSLISLSVFVAACLLSDLAVIAMLSYLVLGGAVSFLPLKYAKEQALVFLMSVCTIAVVHRGLVVWGYANKTGVWMVNDLEAIVTEGPSFGIACDYMTYYQTKCDIEDNKKFIHEGDNVFIIEDYILDSVEFLITGGNISNCSTIDTPIYNETTLSYFELYPEKEPDVVMVSCWYGGLMVDPESMIMKWVEDNYEISGDGRYWRYYRKKQ